MSKPTLIGSRLRAERTERDLTQDQLAELVSKRTPAIGITQASISQIENGETQDPGVSLVNAIEDALALPRGALTTRPTRSKRSVA